MFSHGRRVPPVVDARSGLPMLAVGREGNGQDFDGLTCFWYRS